MAMVTKFAVLFHLGIQGRCALNKRWPKNDITDLPHDIKSVDDLWNSSEELEPMFRSSHD